MGTACDDSNKLGLRGFDRRVCWRVDGKCGDASRVDWIESSDFKPAVMQLVTNFSSKS